MRRVNLALAARPGYNGREMRTRGLNACAALLLLGLLAAASNAATPPRPKAAGPYAESLDTVVITADEAPVTLAGTVLDRVKKGRWFGVTAQKGDLLRIQFWGGRNLRTGWVRAADARVLTDADVDLTAEALRLAKEFDPKLDVAACRARVDALAARVAQAAAAGATPRAKAERISRQLFAAEGFRYEVAARTLDRVLDEKRGNCLGLSLLYLCAAERLGLAFHMLSFPNHALIRYDDGKEQFNVEPSWGGPTFVDDAYMKQRFGPPRGIGWSVLSKPQTMTVLYADLGAILGEHKRLAEATECFVRAVEINPDSGMAYYNWGNVLAAQGQNALACEKYSRTTQLHPTFVDAYNNWGASLHKMGEREWAVEKFATAAKLSPRSAMVHLNWGLVLLELGKNEEATDKLFKAVQLNPALKPFVDQALGRSQ